MWPKGASFGHAGPPSTDSGMQHAFGRRATPCQAAKGASSSRCCSSSRRRGAPAARTAAPRWRLQRWAGQTQVVRVGAQREASLLWWAHEGRCQVSVWQRRHQAGGAKVPQQLLLSSSALAWCANCTADQREAHSRPARRRCTPASRLRHPAGCAAPAFCSSAASGGVWLGGPWSAATRAARSGGGPAGGGGRE